MVANERGQLLLVGGIAIAIVVFSTILFAHSLAVTDGITTTGSANTIERSADREASVERDFGRLAAQTRGDDLDTYEKRYEKALENYTETHNRVVASSGGTYLSATLNESASLGNETSQLSPGEIDDPNGGSNEWVVAKNVSRIAVFNFTFTEGHDSGKPFNITVTGSNGNWWALEVSLNGTGSPKNKTVTIRDSAPGSDTPVCTSPNSGPESKDLRVNLITGTCNQGSVFKTFSDVTKPPYTINVSKGQKATGTYRFAAIGTFPSTSSPYPVVPAVDTTYHIPSASYNRTVLVEVDDG